MYVFRDNTIFGTRIEASWNEHVSETKQAGDQVGQKKGIRDGCIAVQKVNGDRRRWWSATDMTTWYYRGTKGMKTNKCRGAGLLE